MSTVIPFPAKEALAYTPTDFVQDAHQTFARLCTVRPGVVRDDIRASRRAFTHGWLDAIAYYGFRDDLSDHTADSKELREDAKVWADLYAADNLPKMHGTQQVMEASVIMMLYVTAWVRSAYQYANVSIFPSDEAPT